MTNEQILAHVRAMRQNAIAVVSSADVILASLQPAPQEPPKRKARYLGDDTSQPANGQVADG